MSEQHTQARGLSVRGTLLGWRVGLSVAVVLILAVLRGMPPALVEWPYAHWLINYDFGFVKRGFVGEVAQTLGLALDPQHATQTLNTLAWVIFGVLVLALIAVGVRMLHRTQRAPLVVMLLVLFFASGFMVMAANLIGYYDHIWQIGTILTVWLILRRHLMAAGLTQIVWVLVHESYLMSGYPIVVFALGLAWIQRAQPQPMARACFAFALLAPLMAFVGVFLAHDVQDSNVLSQQLLTRLGEYDALSDVFTPFFVKELIETFPR